MDDKRIELLRSDEEINLELKDEADAWWRFVESLPQYNNTVRYFEKSSVKTDWLNKKMR